MSWFDAGGHRSAVKVVPGSGELNINVAKTGLLDFEFSPFNYLDIFPYMLTYICKIKAIFSSIKIFMRTRCVLKLLMCHKSTLLKAL